MTPVRLHKQETTDDRNAWEKWCENGMNKGEEWVLNHSFLCLFILFALLISLFVVVISSLVGVSATESGMMRNFVNGGYV